MLVPLQEYPYKVRPMISAHRGDTSRGAPENSLEAIEHGLETGADMIEVDVQWTADEVFVCYHDESVPMADGTSRVLHQLTFRELTDLEIQGKLAKGVRPAPLLSVLEMTRDKVYLNLEIKEYSRRDPKLFMQALDTLLRKTGMRDYVLFSGFRLDYLKAAAWGVPVIVIQPDSMMMQYFNDRSTNPIETKQPIETLKPSEVMALCNATAYACHVDELTPERLADIRARNLLVSVYTVTTEEEFDRVLSLGVGGMVCENTAKFVALRNQRFPAPLAGGEPI